MEEKPTRKAKKGCWQMFKKCYFDPPDPPGSDDPVDPVPDPVELPIILPRTMYDYLDYFSLAFIR
jgi:hypothetical protein